MAKTAEEKEAIKNRLRNATKNYYCTGCGVQMTLLVSLFCNCGGEIKPQIRERKS